MKNKNIQPQTIKEQKEEVKQIPVPVYFDGKLVKDVSWFQIVNSVQGMSIKVELDGDHFDYTPALIKVDFGFKEPRYYQGTLKSIILSTRKDNLITFLSIEDVHEMPGLSKK